MKIIGLDVGRGSAVLCCLDKFPTNIQQHYKKLKREKQFIKLSCDNAGVDRLYKLNSDGIVLEPTGHWYSHFWATVAKANNIAIYWLGHTDLDSQRGSYGFVNKRDEEDALCLAASYFDDRFINSDGSKRFLNYYYSHDEIIARCRELFLEKEQLQKLRSALIAQLRQKLSYEYPEGASHLLRISDVRGFTPFIGWLSSRYQGKRYENKYRLSVANRLGIEISDYTRDHAKTINDMEIRITQHYDRLNKMLDVPEFQSYLRVFDRFGFGIDNKIILLYHCYPLDKFLVDGKAWIEREENKQGKL